ncbi:hypothetical protein AB0M47_23175 [Hamadaea sp. NPDC051192]
MIDVEELATWILVALDEIGGTATGADTFRVWNSSSEAACGPTT